MKREKITPRPNYISKLRQMGFGFHPKYWDEKTAYSFTMDEILLLESATNELWEMCLNAVEHIIANKLYHLFPINQDMVRLIEKSWEEEWPSIYSRFDLCYKDGQIKMLEINGDTPTSLFEASVIQWQWQEDYFEGEKDQFNSIHEKLIDYWGNIHEYIGEKLHFASLKGNLEDITTVEYLRDCAKQAGLDTKFLYIEDIGLNDGHFIDQQNNRIESIFKLYPWEWMMNEEYSKNVLDSGSQWIEPPWKVLLSSKAILPILWQLYPKHELLLEAHFGTPKLMKDYAIKPSFSREGANIILVKDGQTLESTDGIYGEGSVYQQLCELPQFLSGTQEVYPVIGSWIINQESAGIGIRESYSRITGNTSKFIPHYIDK